MCVTCQPMNGTSNPAPIGMNPSCVDRSVRNDHCTPIASPIRWNTS